MELTCALPSRATRLASRLAVPMNSNDATARPVEQAMARPASCWRVLPVFFRPRYCPTRRARAVGEDRGVAGGDRDAVAFGLLVGGDRFGEARPRCPGPGTPAGDQPRDAFGFLPAERGDDGAEGDWAAGSEFGVREFRLNVLLPRL